MRVASLGECMVELSPRPGGLYGLGFGGDTLNTAVYLARLGLAIDYVTVMGDDSFSDRLVAAWAEEGVGTGMVARAPGRMPGLYIIETDSRGERRFHYWRDRAPARELFELADPTPRLDHELVYLTGISLSIWGERGREQVQAMLSRLRGRIAFDSNYRPRGWPDVATARDAMARVLAEVDVALVGFDDEQVLHGDANPEATVARLHAAGVTEIVVKDGANGAWVADGGRLVQVPVKLGPPPVDTTGAGDSFNAAYLAARACGADPVAAVRQGHILAAAVCAHPGAIIPKAAMPYELRR